MCHRAQAAVRRLGCIQQMVTSNSSFAESTGSRIGNVYTDNKAAMSHEKVEKKVFVQSTVPKGVEGRLKYVNRAAHISNMRPVFSQRRKTKSSHRVIHRFNKQSQSPTNLPLFD